MPLMLWSQLLSVGVAEIDDQHKELLLLLNELNDNMKYGRGSLVIEKIVNGMLEYTKYHFNTEERLMARTAYPDLKIHKAEHDVFVKRVADFRRDYRDKSLHIIPDVMRFLRNWLFKHITEVDKRLGEYLVAKGIK